MNSQLNKNKPDCPLCKSDDNVHFFVDKFRSYLKCRVCALIFVPPRFYVSPEDEKSRYEEHNNDAGDKGYRNFLKRIVTPVQDRFAIGANGLDFGCGPTQVLAEMLENKGFEMEVYDPIYARDKAVFESGFDFVVSTEVVEHLRRPMFEIKRLISLLKEGGMLALMTRLYDKSISFRGWHYKNDRTHICFYSLETFRWLSRELDIRCELFASDILVFDTRKQFRTFNV